MRGNVLIFEDDIDLGRQWSGEFRRAGAEVVLTADRADAIAWCRDRVFDLLIVDMFIEQDDGSLSHDGGLLLINQLRRQLVAGIAPEYRTVPIIAVTAAAPFSASDVLRNATFSGADVALRKPLVPTDLLAAAVDLVDERHLAGN